MTAAPLLKALYAAAGSDPDLAFLAGLHQVEVLREQLGDRGDAVPGVGQHVPGGPDDVSRGHRGAAASAATFTGGGQALAGAGDDELADELGQGGEDVEDQPAAGGGRVEGLVQ